MTISFQSTEHHEIDAPANLEALYSTYVSTKLLFELVNPLWDGNYRGNDQAPDVKASGVFFCLQRFNSQMIAPILFSN